MYLMQVKYRKTLYKIQILTLKIKRSEVSLIRIEVHYLNILVVIKLKKGFYRMKLRDDIYSYCNLIIKIILSNINYSFE